MLLPWYGVLAGCSASTSESASGRQGFLITDISTISLTQAIQRISLFPFQFRTCLYYADIILILQLI